MTLGISVGVRRTLWMMWGELLGIAVVAMAALLGVASLMVAAPGVFLVAKWLGAAYLLWFAYGTWHASAADAGVVSAGQRYTPGKLAVQGFVTATSNPKAWLFFAALLPPFIDTAQPLAPQAATLIAAMLCIEFLCMLAYAQGGRILQDALARRGLGRWLHRISAALIVLIAVWLVLG